MPWAHRRGSHYFLINKTNQRLSGRPGSSEGQVGGYEAGQVKWRLEQERPLRH